MSFFVTDAYAAAEGAAQTQQGSGTMTLVFIVLFFVFFWFMMIRPQQKKQKEHRKMIDAVAKGDEVVLSGGILGKVTDVAEDIASVEIANGVIIKIQKGAIANMLPKGSVN
jgi:preprotein translocase subunit YajC